MKTWIKLIIGIGVMGILFLVPILSKGNTIFNNITYKTFKEKVKTEEFTFIYIGSPNCSHCVNMKPSLVKLVEEEKAVIYYLNSSKLSNDEITEISELDDALASFGTPTLIFVKDGDIIGTQVGEADYDTLKTTYYKYRDYVDTTTYYTKNNYKTFLANYESDKQVATVVCKSTDEKCTEYKNIINKVAKKTNVDINYIEVDKLSEKNQKNFKKLNAKFEKVTVPYTIITKSGKVISELDKVATYEELVTFLIDNSLLVTE